jgi:phospholipase/carboxylesterase
MFVLEDPPTPDLTDTAILTVVGQSDPYASYAAILEDILRSRGARLKAQWLPAGHELVPDDAAVVREWVNE